MKIGDEVYIHGYIDEIRNDMVIIRNDGGYFGTVLNEVKPKEEPQMKYPTEWCEDCKFWREDNCIGVVQCKANIKAIKDLQEYCGIKQEPTLSEMFNDEPQMDEYYKDHDNWYSETEGINKL